MIQICAKCGEKTSCPSCGTHKVIPLLPRQTWLIQRVQSCLSNIETFKDKMTWNEYMEKSKDLAKELLYACTEWEKYYKDMETK